MASLQCPSRVSPLGYIVFVFSPILETTSWILHPPFHIKQRHFFKLPQMDRRLVRKQGSFTAEAFYLIRCNNDQCWEIAAVLRAHSQQLQQPCYWCPITITTTTQDEKCCINRDAPQLLWPWCRSQRSHYVHHIKYAQEGDHAGTKTVCTSTSYWFIEDWHVSRPWSRRDGCSVSSFFWSLLILLEQSSTSTVCDSCSVYI